MDRTKPKRRSNTDPRTERLSVAQDKLASTVAGLWFSGNTQNEIAAQTGLTRKQVYHSLRRSKELWHEWRLDDWDTRITGELARIDRVESEAWAASQSKRMPLKGSLKSERHRMDQVAFKKSRSASMVGLLLEDRSQLCRSTLSTPRCIRCGQDRGIAQDQQQHGNTIPQGMIVVVDTPEQANHILGYSQFIEAIEKPNSM